jgi:hypothetical protein
LIKILSCRRLEGRALRQPVKDYQR